MKNLLWQSALTLSGMLRDKLCSSREIVDEYLGHTLKHNKNLNSLIEVYAESAKKKADEVDNRRAKGDNLSALAGIPIIIKDNLLLEGHRVSAGSQILESYVATYDATVVERLKKNDAIILGRANMDEFAMGSSCETSHYGPTKNPWDTTRIPGGSSGGSAASVTASFAPWSLGSDTGGSVRQPASLCGLVGLKPTYGRVSRSGLIALASSLDQIGPFTRTVADSALLMQHIEGADPKDPTSCYLSNTYLPNLEALSENLTGLKVGLPKEFFAEGMDDAIRESIMKVIETLKEAGAEIVEVSLPHAPFALETYYILLPSEASSNLARFDGVRYGFHASGETLLETYEKTRGEGFGDEVKRRIILGTFSLSAGAHDAFYNKALAVRDSIRNEINEVLTNVDVILGPTSPSVAWKIGEKFADPLTMYLSDIYTIPANLAGVPAISVPCGFVNGLPVGFQMMAKSFSEDTLYRVGHTYQMRTDWHKQTPADLL